MLRLLCFGLGPALAFRSGLAGQVAPDLCVKLSTAHNIQAGICLIKGRPALKSVNCQ